MKRRCFLKATLATAESALLFGTGVLTPARVSADWPADAFHAKTLDDALQAMFDEIQPAPNGAIIIQARDIAEDGRSVPVGVRSNIEGSQSISLFSEKNPNPAVATFRLTPRIDAYVETRIKMGDSGNVIVVVTAEGKHYSAKKRIQVTSGGCA